MRKKRKADEPKGEEAGPEKTADDFPTMPPEEVRNSGLIVLMLFSQAYYTMLESVVSMGGWCSAVDVELNGSYLWTVECLQKLLKNHPDLKDFPEEFKPLVPDLLPSTICKWEWEDMAPLAQGFLGSVQRYVMTKGFYEPEKGTPAWVFVEWYRPGVNRAIEQAVAYRGLMQQGLEQMLPGATASNPGEEPKVGNPPATTENKGDVSNPANVTGKMILTCGRLEYRPGFNEIWVDGVLYDLRERTQARLCIQYLVENRAFDIESARHFEKQIDKFVRSHSNSDPAADPKIDHYFNPPSRKQSEGKQPHRRLPDRKLPNLRKLLIHATGRRDGRYFLKIA